MEEKKNWEQEEVNGYYIRCGKLYQVFRTDVGDYTFYKIKVKRGTSNGEKLVADKQVIFDSKEGRVDIPDGTWVRPLKLYEGFYYSKKDINKYNPIFTVVFKEWELSDKEQENLQKANNEYLKSIAVADMDFKDEELPF